MVFAVAAISVLWQLGATVMEDHECKLALVARTMAQWDPNSWIIQSGWDYEVPRATAVNRWMVPVENGRPRLVKTPLPYWVAAASMKIGGASEWTARLPSALCAVLLGWLTLAMGRRMLTPRAAVMGAILLAASVGFQKWGRDARPEMMLCLWMTAAMGCFRQGLEAQRRGSRVAWMAAFWVAMGLANLSKQFVPLLLAWPLLAYVLWRESARRAGDEGALRLLRWFLIASGLGLAAHLAISLAPFLHWWQRAGLEPDKGYYLTMAAALGAPMAWYFLRARGWGAAGRLLPTAVPGLALMMALFVPWMLYMDRLFPALARHVFSEQVTERAAGIGPWVLDPRVHIYLQSLLTLCLPWLAFVPGGFAVALMRRFHEHRRGLVFLLLWSVGLIGLFTASAGKREHYILPMLPAFCLLMGFAAEDVVFNHRWIPPRLARLLGAAHGAAGIVAVIVVAALGALGRVFLYRDQWLATVATAAAAAAPAIAAGVLAWRGRLRPLVPLLAASMAIFYLGYHGTIRYWDERGAIRDFARGVAQRVAPLEPLYEWGDPQAKMAYYVGRLLPAFQWSFQKQNPLQAGEDPGAYQSRIDGLSLDWLRRNPQGARWMIGYDPNQPASPAPGKNRPGPARGARPDLLHPLTAVGYEPVFQRQDLQERQYLFTLYERKGPGASNRAEAR